MADTTLKAQGTLMPSFWKTYLDTQGPQHWKSSAVEQIHRHTQGGHPWNCHKDGRDRAWLFLFLSKHRQTGIKVSSRESIMLIKKKKQLGQYNETAAWDDNGENNSFLHVDSPTRLLQLWGLSHLGLRFSSAFRRPDLLSHAPFWMEQWAVEPTRADQSLNPLQVWKNCIGQKLKSSRVRTLTDCSGIFPYLFSWMK